MQRDQTGRSMDSTSAMTSSGSDVIAETDHSVIEKCYHDGLVAVLKRARSPQEPRAVIRWRSEVEMLQSIGRHPNITQLLASDLSTLTLTLGLEPGRPLSSYISSTSNISTLTRPESTHLLSSLSSALAHLHTLPEPIVHADIKPENIMFSRSPTAHFVLIDFGAAFYLKDAPDFNPSGTPSFVAPEFLQRQRGAGMDVWAIGVTMLWALGKLGLPDGEWYLPGVFEEGSKDREALLAWFERVRGLRERLGGEGLEEVMRRMLDEQVGHRIGSVEVVEMMRGMLG